MKMLEALKVKMQSAKFLSLLLAVGTVLRGADGGYPVIYVSDIFTVTGQDQGTSGVVHAQQANLRAWAHANQAHEHDAMSAVRVGARNRSRSAQDTPHYAKGTVCSRSRKGERIYDDGNAIGYVRMGQMKAALLGAARRQVRDRHGYKNPTQNWRYKTARQEQQGQQSCSDNQKVRIIAGGAHCVIPAEPAPALTGTSSAVSQVHRSPVGSCRTCKKEGALASSDALLSLKGALFCASCLGKEHMNLNAQITKLQAQLAQGVCAACQGAFGEQVESQGSDSTQPQTVPEQEEYDLVSLPESGGAHHEQQGHMCSFCPRDNASRPVHPIGTPLYGHQEQKHFMCDTCTQYVPFLYTLQIPQNNMILFGPLGTHTMHYYVGGYRRVIVYSQRLRQWLMV